MVQKKFTTAWKESKQPRKQRKYLHNLPLHLKQKLMSAPLAKELREKHGVRNMEVRKGDEVRVTRGKFKKKTGKITEVNLKKSRIAIENVQNTKKDGNKINAWLHPSKVIIKSLNTEDKKRIKTKLRDKENVTQSKK